MNEKCGLLAWVYDDGTEGLGVEISGCDCVARDPRCQLVYAQAMLISLQRYEAALLADAN